MALLADAEESCLEFLSTCDESLSTSWSAKYGDLGTTITLIFSAGVITGSGSDKTGDFDWSGELGSNGKLLVTKQYRGKHSIVHSGVYDSLKNSISGVWNIESANVTGKFTFKLNVPDIAVHFEEAEEDGQLLKDPEDKAAIEKYKSQREKVAKAPLGSFPEELLTTWSALYVYGSGRSDTVRDIVLHINKSKISGVGKDKVGKFTWDGTLEPDGRCVLVKAYEGAHQIKHTGTYNPNTNVIKGAWTIPGTRACGGFQMSEHVPIRALEGGLDAEAIRNKALSDGAAGPAGDTNEAALSNHTCAETVWSALYVYGSGRNDKVKDVVLLFDKGNVSGAGEDGIGKYTWNGTYDNGELVLNKNYTAKHTVEHEGKYEPTNDIIRGSWKVPGTRAIGVFHLTEKPSLRKALNPNRVAPLGTFEEEAVCDMVAEYAYGSGRRDTIPNIVLNVIGKALNGRGTDHVGAYTWTGSISGDKFQLVKQYTGKHAIHHEGTYDASNDRATGDWSIPGTRATGQFTFTENKLNRKLKGDEAADPKKKKRRSEKGRSRSSTVTKGTEGNATATPLKHDDKFSTFWRGWCEMGKRRDEMKEFALTFKSGKIEGEGSDQVGSFTFVGSIDSKMACTLTKQYKGMHSMTFTGAYDGKTHKIAGNWTMPGTRAKGVFELVENCAKRKAL